MSDPIVKTRPVRPAPPRVTRAIGKQMAHLAKECGAMDPALAANWADIVGADLARLCRPVRIIRRARHQALEIAVTSGAAATRVQFSQAQILQRAAHHLRLPTLKTLTIRQAGSTATASPRQKGRRGSGGWASAKLTAADLPKVTSPPEPPATSVDEALRRLRRSLSTPPR